MAHRFSLLRLCAFLPLMLACLIHDPSSQTESPFKPVPLVSHITHVQPMTGIVLWTTSEQNRTDAVQLEYSYMKYGDVVRE